MKDPLLLGRFTQASIAALAFAAAGSRIAVATSDLTLEKGRSDAVNVAVVSVLIALGVLVLALGDARSTKRWPRTVARAAGAGIVLIALGVFVGPGVAMLR